jgi:ribonucleotide monophosphatase NagD (HAD superfamily)
VPLEKAHAAVCTGLFDDTAETPEDYAATLARMKALGLPMICANPDKIVRRGAQIIYCAGAIAERYEENGGRCNGRNFTPAISLEDGCGIRNSLIGGRRD